jgi:DNA-binding transcriptional MerR regulator
MDDDLVPIGRFSRMSRLSIKALRRYDDLGLLVPARVDPSSGYRYYRFGQANRAEAIRILRQVDMPLDEIRELLADDDPDVVTKRLGMHRERLEERLAHQQRMLRFLQRLIDRRGAIMPYEIAAKQIPTQPVASWTSRTTLATIGDVVGRGLTTVMGALTAAGTEPAGPPFIVYHDVTDEQADGTVEICIPVPPGVNGVAADVEWKEMPGGAVAWATHRGPYDEIGPAYHTITGWIQDHQRQITGAPREIYLNDPQTVVPEDLLTEIQFPIDHTT